MKKQTLLYVMMTAILVSAVAGLCEDVLAPGQSCNMTTPVIRCDNYTYEVLNETGQVENGSLTLINSSVYYFTFSQGSGDYVVRLCDNSTREIYVQGDDEMASLSITFFVLLITGFFLFLPRIAGRFSKFEWLDLLLKRCCYVLAIFLMTLNIGIMATIADLAGLNVSHELFGVYLFIFGWGGWCFMAFLVVKTLFDTLDLYKKRQQELRMGY